MPKPEQVAPNTGQPPIPEFLHASQPYASFLLEDGEYLLYKFNNETFSIWIPNDDQIQFLHLRSQIVSENVQRLPGRRKSDCPVVLLELGAVSRVDTFSTPSQPVSTPLVTLEGSNASDPQKKSQTVELDAVSVATLFRPMLPTDTADHNFFEMRGPSNTLIIAFDTPKGIFVLENSVKFPAVTQLSEFLSRLTREIRTGTYSKFANNALLQAELAVEQNWVESSVPDGVPYEGALHDIYIHMYYLEVFFIALALESESEPAHKSQLQSKLLEILPTQATERLLAAYSQRASALRPNTSILSKMRAWLELQSAKKAQPPVKQIGVSTWRKALPTSTFNLLTHLEAGTITPDSDTKPPEKIRKDTTQPEQTTQPLQVRQNVDLKHVHASAADEPMVEMREMGDTLRKRILEILHSQPPDFSTLNAHTVALLRDDFAKLAATANAWLPHVSIPQTKQPERRTWPFTRVSAAEPSNPAAKILLAEVLGSRIDEPIFGLSAKSLAEFDLPIRGTASYQSLLKQQLQSIRELLAFRLQFNKEPVLRELGTYIFAPTPVARSGVYAGLARRIPENVRRLLNENRRTAYQLPFSIENSPIIMLSIQVHIVQLLMTFESWVKSSRILLGKDLQTWLQAIIQTQQELESIFEPFGSALPSKGKESNPNDFVRNILTGITAIRKSEINLPKSVYTFGHSTEKNKPLLEKVRYKLFQLPDTHNLRVRSSITISYQTRQEILATIPAKIQTAFLLSPGSSTTYQQTLGELTQHSKTLQDLILRIARARYSDHLFRTGEPDTVNKLKRIHPLYPADRECIKWIEQAIPLDKQIEISAPRFAHELLQILGLQLIIAWAGTLAEVSSIPTHELSSFAQTSLEFLDSILTVDSN